MYIIIYIYIFLFILIHTLTQINSIRPLLKLTHSATAVYVISYSR